MSDGSFDHQLSESGVSMAAERYIALSEAIYVPTNITCVATAVVEGTLDESEERAFRQAYETLTRVSAPLLRGRIDSDDQGYRFVVPDDARLTVVVRDDGEAGYWEEAHRSLDSQQELSRLVLVRGSERSSVTLVVHHAVADGHGVVGLFTRFWQHYVAAISGESVPVETTATLPASMEQILWQRLDGKEPSVVPGGLFALGGTSPGVSRVSRVRLSVQETTALTAAARKQRTWPHAFVCGAVLLALRDSVGTAGPVRLGCASAVDLRNRMSPPLTVEEVTSFTGGHHVELDVSAGDKAVDLGREVLSQLDEAISKNGWQSLVMDFSRAAVEVSSIPMAVVSNLGSMPKLTSPSGIVVSDLRSFANLSQGQPVCFASFYDGQLSIEISYSPDSTYTEEYWERFGACVVEQLTSV
jgi:hypothetical protein